MKKKAIRTIIAAIVSVMMLMTMLCGCGNKNKTEDTAEPAETSEAVEASEAKEAPEAGDEVEASEAEAEVGTPGAEAEAIEAEAEATGTEAEMPEATGTETGAVEVVRQVGERFEEVFMLDVEEKINFEHIRLDEIGIEMDYPYELFERSGETDRECFYAVNDYSEEKEYYFDVAYKAENAEIVAASISEALSGEYKLNRENHVLERAGNCIWIGASEAISGGSPEHLQEAWIIPAGDGCVVMTGHSGLDSSDFFGAYYRYIANSIAVINGK